MTAEAVETVPLPAGLDAGTAEVLRNVERIAQEWADPDGVPGAWGTDDADACDLLSALVDAWAAFAEGRPLALAGPLTLELCTGATPECPHYGCPDGWHRGAAPNCSCTPDCAQLVDDD